MGRNRSFMKVCRHASRDGAAIAGAASPAEGSGAAKSGPARAGTRSVGELWMKRAWFARSPITPSLWAAGRYPRHRHDAPGALIVPRLRRGLNPEACKKLIVQLWVVVLVPPLRRSTGPGRPCLRKERPQIMFDLAFTVAYSAGAFVAVGVILRGLAA